VDSGRVPHFSRSLREVGPFADTFPNLNHRSAKFSPPTMFGHGHVSDHGKTVANPHQRVMCVTDEHWN
jgi:hypothetical protein